MVQLKKEPKLKVKIDESRNVQVTEPTMAVIKPPQTTVVADVDN